MKIHTATAQYKASPDTVFKLVSNPENLAKWAKNFCSSIKKEGDDFIITTPTGDELFFSIEANQVLGVIDMLAGPTKEMLWKFPTRIASNNMGGSIFIFTNIQMPNQSDDEFAAGCVPLAEELEIIRSLVD